MSLSRSLSREVSLSLRSAISSSALDGGYGWVVVAASFMVSFIQDGIIYTLGNFTNQMAAEFHASTGAIAVVATVLGATTAFTGPFSSALCQVYGCRAVAVTGSILAFLGLMLGALANSVGMAVFSLGFIFGLGIGLAYLPQIIIVTHYFDKRLTLAVGIAICGSGLGMLAMGPFAGYLFRFYTWRVTLAIFAVISSSSILFSAAFRPVMRIDPTTGQVLFYLPGYEPGANHFRLLKDALCRDTFRPKLLCSGTFLLFAFGSLTLNVGFYVPTAFLPALALEMMPDTCDKACAAGFFLYVGGANLVSRISVGLVGDRFSRQGRFYFLQVTIFCFGSLVLSTSLFRTYWLLVTYCILIGLAMGSYVTLVSVVMVDLFGNDNYTAAFGLSSIFFGGGVLVGPVAVGALRDATGNFTVGFQVAGVAMLLNVVLYSFIPCFKSFHEIRSSEMDNESSKRSASASNSGGVGPEKSSSVTPGEEDVLSVAIRSPLDSVDAAKVCPPHAPL